MDWQGFFVLDVEAVIKSAVGTASRKTKSRGPRSREAPGPAALGPLDLVFLEAVPAANLIMASKCS